MSDVLVWYVDDRNPSISQTVTIDGVVQDLTGKTCRFKMRPVGSLTLKVDAAVSNTPDTTGVLRYDWTAADLDTEGLYLGWWEVTAASKTQAVAESLIEVRAHSPLSNCYLELEELRQALQQSGTYADPTFQRALRAASRAIDNLCERRFYLDADANQVRYYTPASSTLLMVDDVETITSVQVDRGGDGTFEETLTANTQYLAEPLNAATDGKPFTRLEPHPASGVTFPTLPRSVKVTGRFGWPEVPSEIIQATAILAHIFALRERDAPFGIQNGGIDGGAVRIARNDPHVMMLCQPFIKHRVA